MNDLPSLYAAVCAKRPDLAVEGLRRKGCDWYQGCMYESDRIAAALILARWVEALPCGVCLVHGFGTGSAVQWWIRLDEGTCCTPVSRTPLEALAAYFLGETA